MWFKNITTGLVWHIVDEKHISELQKSDRFVEIDAPSKKKPSSRKESSQTKTMICDICDKECKGQRSYTQHRRMAHNIDKDGNKIDTKEYNAKFTKKTEKEDGEE